MRRVVAGTIILVFLVLLALLWPGRGHDASGRQTQLLADGSKIILEPPILAATNFLYRYESANRFLRLLRPILPAGLRNRFNFSSGTLGLGGFGNTNLFVVTITQHANRSNRSPERLRVLDENGSEFDSCWGASTLGMNNATVHAWNVRAFPRRSRTLQLQFLSTDLSGGWTNFAEFRIPNPSYAQYPQWIAEPLPITKQDGSVAVTLREFESGRKMRGSRGAGSDSTAPRSTHLLFTFAENGLPATNWLVQKITIADATGNEWFPFLDFVKQDFDWAKAGTVEFFGALWPGENAWKLNIQATRTASFTSNEVWETVVDLPGRNTVSPLTNEWQYAGHVIKLIALASPNTDHAGDFKWTAKWWGANKTKVYSLALQLDGDLNGWWATVADAVDQAAAPVKVVQHSQPGSDKQAVFFIPNEDSSRVRLHFALQRAHSVTFLARPEFFNNPATNGLVKQNL